MRIPRNINGVPNPHRYYVFGGGIGRRHIGGLARVVGRFLKLRYLILTSAVGGGVAASKVIYGTEELFIF